MMRDIHLKSVCKAYMYQHATSAEQSEESQSYMECMIHFIY